MALDNANGRKYEADCVNEVECFKVLSHENYHYPCCPKEITVDLIETYFDNLRVGAVFAYNEESPKLIIVEFVKIKSGSSILVMCEREGFVCERDGFMHWLNFKIAIENNVIIHTNLGSYFDKEEAEEAFSVY